MLLAADYPFLDVLWTILVIFLWISWFMLLFHVIGDVFRRRDASGAKKTLWLITVLFLPFLGVFIYLIANGDDMARRKSSLQRPPEPRWTTTSERSQAVAARPPKSRRPRDCSTAAPSASPSSST